MKIINIILTSQNGGAEQSFIDYTQALSNLGHQVLVILKNDAPYANQFENLGVEVKRISNNLGYHDFIATNKIAQIIKETDASSIISHMSRSTILVKKAVRKIKDKKIFQIAVNHSDNVKRSIGCDLIFSVNKKILLKTVDLGQAEDTSFVIPNAIDLSDAIEPNLAENLAKKNQIIIGAISRFDRSKGLEYLIKTIKILNKISHEQKLNKKFILKIAGSGYFEKNLRNLVKELNLQDEIEFLGWIADKKNFFSTIDIFCLPSLNETFGIVLLEAMKYAKPIIATNSDGPCEILKDGVDALIVDLNPLDKLEERIAAKVLEMINDDEKANLLIKNASKKLKEKYSYQSLEQRLGEIFGSKN